MEDWLRRYSSVSQWNLISEYIPHSPMNTKGLHVVTWIMKLRLFCWHVSNLLCHSRELMNAAHQSPLFVPHYSGKTKTDRVLSTSQSNESLLAKSATSGYSDSHVAKELSMLQDLIMSANLRSSQTIGSLTAQWSEQCVQLFPLPSLTKKRTARQMSTRVSKTRRLILMTCLEVQTNKQHNNSDTVPFRGSGIW